MKRFFLLLPALALSGCNQPQTASTSNTVQSTSNRVVLYCSVDDVYARPIIKDLEKRTGLRIDVLYDTEAAKTAGLANRIRAEKSRPQGDVFWSSALLQTLLLGREELLQPYVSRSAEEIPTPFKDANGLWTGVGYRPRLIVWNQGANVQWNSPRDLLLPENKGKGAISNPQFGTGSDWVAALGTRWGIERTTKYFQDLKKNGVKVLPGNSVVTSRVARGDFNIGVTDSDDFWAERSKSPALQSELTTKIATTTKREVGDDVYVPGSVAMLKGAPHEQNAKKLIDAIVDAETEKQLIQRMKGVYSVRATQLPNTPNDAAQWPAAWDKLRDPIAKILLSD
jgi:iron(III) transport system substrate-binding protein